MGEDATPALGLEGSLFTSSDLLAYKKGRVLGRKTWACVWLYNLTTMRPWAGDNLLFSLSSFVSGLSDPFLQREQEDKMSKTCTPWCSAWHTEQGDREGKSGQSLS